MKVTNLTHLNKPTTVNFYSLELGSCFTGKIKQACNEPLAIYFKVNSNAVIRIGYRFEGSIDYYVISELAVIEDYVKLEAELILRRPE